MKCGYELKDVGHSLTWGALHSFITHLGIDSAVSQDMNPDLHAWSTTFKTNVILADIYDVLALINANLVAIGSRQHTKTPPTYPRPFGKPDGQHYGNDAVPLDDLRNMFVEKRKERNGR